MHWIVKHPEYGIWKVTRKAVVADMKRDYCQANNTDKAPSNYKPANEEVETWFAEQWSWCEVKAYGTLVEKPDFEKMYQRFLARMEKDIDYLQDEGEVEKIA